MRLTTQLRTYCSDSYSGPPIATDQLMRNAANRIDELERKPPKIREVEDMIRGCIEYATLAKTAEMMFEIFGMSREFRAQISPAAKELHEKGELTDKYAQVIRDELDELVER